jgi:SsrA-binding protein
VAKQTGTKLIADNRRARHDYELLERVEAGLVLTGSEVKAVRDGHVQIGHAYGDVRGNEIWLVGASITDYAQSPVGAHAPERDRKLLLHRSEIEELGAKTREKGLTLVPTRLYFKDGRVKIELALARGKERGDKRRAIAEREAQRQIDRALKSRR